jgi:hypothetical protein
MAVMDVMCEFAATAMKSSGPVFDAASRGAVRITRHRERYVLLREAYLEEIIRDAADPRPKSLADLCAGHDAEADRAMLRGWLDDAPAGNEVL